MLILRSATEADSSLVLAWRNDPEVRRWTFTNAEISPEVHAVWYRSVLDAPDRHLFIAEDGGTPVAVVRLDVSGEKAEVHVYVGPGCGGKGHGSRSIALACQWAREHLQIHRFFARILPENNASVQAFKKAGFEAAHIRMECGD